MKKTIIGGVLSLILCTTTQTQAQFNKINEKVYGSCIYREYDKDYEMTRKNVTIPLKWDNVYGGKDEFDKIVEFKFPKAIYKVVVPFSFRKTNDRGNGEYEGKVSSLGKVYECDLIYMTDNDWIILLVYETKDKYTVGTINLKEFK